MKETPDTTNSLTEPLENSRILEKEIFQKNAEFIHHQWKPVDLDGWQTFILDVRKGQPLFFVPICQNLEVFDSLLIQHFSKGYRVITYQRRESEEKVLDTESRTADIESVLEYLNIKKAHFVSHSSGSIATTNLAMKRPSFFISYIWMNLSLEAATDMSFWKKKLAGLAKHVPLPETALVSVLAKTTCGNKKNSLLYKRIYEQFFLIKETANITKIKKWFARSVWSLANYSWADDLSTMTMPVMLMNSDNDQVNSVKAMGKIRDYLPNCVDYNIVKGGWHFFQYPCYDQVIKYMEDFFVKIKQDYRLHEHIEKTKPLE